MTENEEWLVLVGENLFQRAKYVSGGDRLSEYMNEDDFKRYYTRLSAEQQQRIIGLILYNSRGRWSYEKRRLNINKLLELSRPAVEHEENNFVLDYVTNGEITLYRGTDGKEAAKARAGNVADLGYCWTFKKYAAYHYATAHRTRGRVIEITVPVQYVKFALMPEIYGLNDGEINISPPEVWPRLKGPPHIKKITVIDLIRERITKRRMEDNDLKQMLEMVKDVKRLERTRPQREAALDAELEQLKQHYFSNP